MASRESDGAAVQNRRRAGIDQSTKVSIGLVLAVFAALVVPAVNMSARVNSLVEVAEKSDHHLSGLEEATNGVRLEVQQLRVSFAGLEVREEAHALLNDERVTTLKELIVELRKRIELLEKKG